MTIRPATPDDMAAVNDIRNHYVRTSTAIYTHLTEPTRASLRSLLDRVMAGL